jgi:DNA primase
MITPRPKVDIDRLKDAIKIADLAVELGLEVRGRQARCFNTTGHAHGDRNFSLGLDINRNRFKCFTCGASGSVIDLYKDINNTTVAEAITALADRAGLSTTTHTEGRRDAFTYKDDQRPVQTPKKQKDYSEIYEDLVFLCGGLDTESERYLKGDKRGLTDETLNRFVLCGIKDYQKLDKDLKAKHSIEDLRESGLLSDKDSLIFYKHKVIIPFIKDGRIIFLQGRRLDTGDPKYLHLKGRQVPLYNTDTLANLSKGDTVYVCEGVFDAMILEQNGYKAVAILGVNNFKDDMTTLFKGLKVVLCLDNDKAGKEGIQTIAKTFLTKGQQVFTKELPDGVKDITDYFTSG